MSLKVGDKAPEFSLINHDLEKVSLKDFSGKNVVLIVLSACKYRSLHKRNVHFQG